MPLPRFLQMIGGAFSMGVPVSASTGSAQASSLVATNTSGYVDPTLVPSVAVTGGTVDGTVIGGTTPAAGSFTTLNVSTQLLGPNTNNNNSPDYSFQYSTSSGMYWTGNYTSLVCEGTAFLFGSSSVCYHPLATQFTSQNGASYATAVFNGTLYTGGTGTTTFPMLYFLQGATAPTGWSTSGTYIGINSLSTFAGNFLHFWLNGTSKFTLSSTGTVTSVAVSTTTLTASGVLTSAGQVAAAQVLTTATTLTSASQEVAINAAVTTTLPASPTVGQKLRLVNLTASAVTISGNGHNITYGAAAAASISLAAYAQVSLTYLSSTVGWA